MVSVGVLPGSGRVWPSNHGYSGIAPASGHNLDSGIAPGIRPSRPARTGTARRRRRRRGRASSRPRSWRVGQHRCARSAYMAWRVRGGSLYPAGAHATVGSPTNCGAVSWSPAQLDQLHDSGCRALELRALEPVGELPRPFGPRLRRGRSPGRHRSPGRRSRSSGRRHCESPTASGRTACHPAFFGPFLSWRINVCPRRIRS